MTCSQIETQLPLYFYGELTQEEEERIEHHAAGCEGCATEIGRMGAVWRAIDDNALTPSEALLREARADLRRELAEDRLTTRPLPSKRRQTWMERLRSLMGVNIAFSVPAGALALLAVGFFAGRFGNALTANSAGVQQAGFVNVRSVEPDATGKVRIVLDNVSQRTVSGSPDDPRIRALLLTSLKEESNPGVRVEALGLIKDRAADTEVRNALLDRAQRDANIGVRINAIEGLKQYGGDAEVRKAMIGVLETDTNAGVRMRAIDLLTAHKDPSLVGPLQTAVGKEENGYVRMRMTDTLREMNASLGTF